MGLLYSRLCDTSSDQVPRIRTEVQNLRLQQTVMRCTAGEDFDDSPSGRLLQQHIDDLEEASRLALVSRSSARVSDILNGLKGVRADAYDRGRSNLDLGADSIRDVLDQNPPSTSSSLDATESYPDVPRARPVLQERDTDPVLKRAVLS